MIATVLFVKIVDDFFTKKSIMLDEKNIHLKRLSKY